MRQRELVVGHQHLGLDLLVSRLVIHGYLLIDRPSMPAKFLHEFFKHRRWIRGKQELSLDLAEQVQQAFIIVFAVSVIVAAVRVIIRRVAVEETIRSVTAGNHIKRIGAFDLAVLQPDGEFLGKPVFFAVDLLGSGVPGLVKAPGTVQLGAVALGA